MDGEAVVGVHPDEAGLQRHNGLQNRAPGVVVRPRDPAAQLGDRGREGSLAQPRPFPGFDRPLGDRLPALERGALVLERVELPVVLVVGDGVALPAGGQPGHLPLVAREVLRDVGQLVVGRFVPPIRHGRGSLHDEVVGAKQRVTHRRPDGGVEEIAAVVRAALAARAPVAGVNGASAHASADDPEATVTVATAGQGSTQRRHGVLRPDWDAPPGRERGVGGLPGAHVHQRGDRQGVVDALELLV